MNGRLVTKLHQKSLQSVVFESCTSWTNRLYREFLKMMEIIYINKNNIYLIEFKTENFKKNNNKELTELDEN